MKTELIIGTIGVLLVALIAGINLTNNQHTTALNTVTNVTPTNEQVNAQLQAAAASGSTTLDMALVNQHNTAEDCWLLINDKVYDVTSYLRLHPGGRAIIIPFCGKDATQAFNTQAGQGSHSSFATEQLAAFYIGDLGMALTVPADQLAANVNTTTTTLNTNVPPVPSTTISQPVAATVELDAVTVSRHDNVNDCWLIISGGVYDVTNYLSQHPGGRSIILPFCGKDATQAFNTKAGQGSHSSFAVNELALFKIGDLGSTTTVDTIQQTQQNIEALPAQPAGEDGGPEDESEWEDEHEYEYDD